MLDSEIDTRVITKFLYLPKYLPCNNKTFDKWHWCNIAYFSQFSLHYKWKWKWLKTVRIRQYVESFDDCETEDKWYDLMWEDMG